MLERKKEAKITLTLKITTENATKLNRHITRQTILYKPEHAVGKFNAVQFFGRMRYSVLRYECSHVPFKRHCRYKVGVGEKLAKNGGEIV